jgi:hypothetical protein
MQNPTCMFSLMPLSNLQHPPNSKMIADKKISV